jgi:Asp-tRNA(Asn)/Glu-tRNA(Gln) amidotransferase A subunit family amidase
MVAVCLYHILKKKEPIGIMLNGSTGMDDTLLEIGSMFENIFSK